MVAGRRRSTTTRSRPQLDALDRDSRTAARVGLLVSVAQAGALTVAAATTGSAGLTAQTATGIADVAAGLFLLIGVRSSSRRPDQQHPLGYGRERFFWSFLAAVGIFVGGFGVSVVESLRAFVDPGQVDSFLFGYVVLAALLVSDLVSLAFGLRPLLRRASQRHTSLASLLWRGTDPAVTTVVLSSAAGIAGGLLAMGGLAGRELTGDPTLDAAAGALIGLVLLATSVVLLHTNRELLTGRGLPPDQTALMRDLIGSQVGVLDVPDLFALVVGPGTAIVDADVVFDDGLDVPAVERAIVIAAEALRRRWPVVGFVYINPVGQRRERRGSRPALVVGEHHHATGPGPEPAPPPGPRADPLQHL